MFMSLFVVLHAIVIQLEEAVAHFRFHFNRIEEPASAAASSSSVLAVLLPTAAASASVADANMESAFGASVF